MTQLKIYRTGEVIFDYQSRPKGLKMCYPEKWPGKLFKTTTHTLEACSFLSSAVLEPIPCSVC